MTAAEQLNIPPGIESVIEEVSNGMSLKASLQKHGVKSSTFFAWLERVPLLDGKYTRAKENHADLLASEIKDLAGSDENTHKVRNMIDAYKWIASKFKPKDYSDRIDLNVTQTVDIRGALDDAKARIRTVLEIAPTQVIESTNTSALGTTGCKPVGDENTDTKNELDKLLG